MSLPFVSLCCICFYFESETHLYHIEYWCCKVVFCFCYYTNCNNSTARTRSKLPKVKHQIPDHETKDLKNFRHLSEELKFWFYNDRDANLVGRGTMSYLLSFCLSFNCSFIIFRWINQIEAVKIGFIDNKIIYYYSHSPGIKSFSLNDNFFDCFRTPELVISSSISNFFISMIYESRHLGWRPVRLIFT